ncbi:MAG: hypothetical protein RLZZ142_588 [Verrucomicrobiota bacterium]|jgi:uncharacterized membrane protein
MTPATESLTFNPTPLSLAFGAAFVLAIALLAWIAARRSQFRPSVCALEGLRLLVACAVALTLNQPEWKQVYLPEFKPTLAILSDVSRSMETRDVADPSNPSAELRPRSEMAQRLADPALWQPLATKFDVVHEPFASTQNPPTEGTDLQAALSDTAEKHPHLKAVVLLSDGDWNTGTPPSQAATTLRMRGIPVFAVPIGSPSRLPDVQLSSFEVPTFAIAGKPLRIPFTIESSLPREESVELEFSTSKGERLTKTVLLPAMGRLQDVFLWKPDTTGEVTLSLTVPPTGTERILENNTLHAPLSVRKEQLRVLIIETLPRWEFRYLRNALERDPGVQVHCVLLHPDLGKAGNGRGYLPAFPKDEDLPQYDVVFLGDIGVAPGQLTPEQCSALQKLVRDQASGLVFLPGLRGFQLTLSQSPLGDLLPVAYDDAQPRGWGTSHPGRLALTEAGAASLLTKLEDSEEANLRVWENLPGFQWFAPASRAKAGSEVLATHDSEANRFGRLPLLVTKTYGAGKILYLGTDGAWRWRKGVEDRYHYRFWGQVVRWMAYQRTMAQGEKMRLFYSPDRPKTGAALTLNANISSTSGEPLRQGNVVIQATAPSGKTLTLRLNPAGEDAWGLFTGVFTPQEPGEYRLRLQCAEAGTPLEAVVSIQGTPREKIGQPARLDVLQEIAQITRGAFFETPSPDTLVAALSALPAQQPVEKRIPLWAHPMWAASLVLLLGIFWLARKSLGSF